MLISSAYIMERIGTPKMLQLVTQQCRGLRSFAYLQAAVKTKGKKAETNTRKAFLGRLSNNLSAGIVGLANVGKSTFFQAITESKIGNPANYPFATIDPAEARVNVPSARLARLQEIYQSSKQVPATLTIWDIAGLTRGASKGEGLGNQFLSDIRAVDGIFQVVRAFDDDEITHIEGSVDPVRDLEIVRDELMLKDMEFCDKHLEKYSKRLKFTKDMNEKRLLTEEVEVCRKALEVLEKGVRIANYDWSDEEITVLNRLSLLSAKPIVYLANVSEEDYALDDNVYIEDIKKWIEANSPGDELILFSASLEEKIADMSKTEAKDYYNDLGVGESVLPKIIHAMRDRLKLISFFTCGPIEARQWSVREGTLAPQAAGVIHTDLEKTFISAHVMKYDDVAKLDNIDDVSKAKVKVYKEGKNYVVEDGDIILFKAAGGKSR